MPTDAEREEVARQATEHLQRMVQLRCSAQLMQLREMGQTADDFGGQFGAGTEDRVQESQQNLPSPKPGIRISALEDPLPFKPLTRQFLALWSDQVLHLFTLQSRMLLKFVRLRKCAIELKRCARLRRNRGAKSWLKYAVIEITGPTLRSIESLDQHLRESCPAYANRKVATNFDPRAAPVVSFFVSEWLPDNGVLSLGNQRTGAVRSALGALKLGRRSSAMSENFGDVRCRNGRREPSTAGFTEAAEFIFSRCPAGQSKTASSRDVNR